MLKISWTFLFQVFACFLFFPKATGLETFITSEVSPLFGKSLVHNGKSIVPCHIFRPDRKTAFLQFLYATYEVIPSFNHSTNISQLNFIGVGLTNQMDQSSTRIHVSLASEGKEIYRLSVPYKTTSNYTEATSLGKFRWFTSPESRIFEVKVSFPLQDLYLPKYDKNKVLPAGVYDVEVYVRNTKKDEERSCIRIHRAFTVHPVTIPVKLSLMSPVIGNPLIAGNLSFPFQSWDRVYVDISNNTRNVTFLPKLIPIDSIPFDYFAENSTLTFNLHRTGSFERVMPNNETVLHLLDPLSDGCNDIHSVNLTFISQTVGYFVMPYCADSRWELSYTFPDNYHRIETVFYAVESSTKLDETVYHANLLLTSPQGLNPINQTIYAMYIALQSAVPSLQLPYNSSYIDLFTVASEAVQGVMIDPTARASLNQLSNLTSENSSFYISSALVEEIAFIEQLKWSNFYEVPVNQEAVVFIDGNFSQRRLDSSSSLEIVFPSLFNKRIEEKKINKKNMHTIHTEGSISSSSYCVVSDFIDILQQTANAVHQLERANKKIDEMFIQLKILERLLKLNKIPSWKYYTMYAKINAKVTISYAVVGVCLKSVYLLIQRAIEMYQESCYVLCDLNQDYVPYSSSGICNSPFYLFWYQDIQHINVDVNGCFAQSFPNISYQIRYLLSGPFSLISRVLSYLPEGLRDKFKVNELQNLVNNFFYQPPRESVEITRHNIVQGYSENHFCDFNNWPFISCDCSLLSEEYLERIENNVNLNIGIAYKMSSYLPAVKKIFPIYLQPAAPVYSPTAAPVFISSSPTTLQPTYSTLIPAALVLTSPNADAGTYNHYPVSGNVDVFVRSDNNYVIYWTTFCGGSWRTKEGLYELSDYVVPGGKWYGGGFWYPAFLCDANKAAGKYDLNTIWFSSGCSMSFSY